MDQMNNLSSFIQSRQQQSRLDDMQRQIQDELVSKTPLNKLNIGCISIFQDLMPVRESDVQYHDPFAMAQPKKTKKKKKVDPKKDEQKQEEEPNSLLNDEMFVSTNYL